MHDDTSRNRIFVTEDHSLVIRKVRPQDGAYYFCYDVGDRRREVKMDILLDIEHRTTLEPRVLRLPADLDAEVAKWLRPCEKISKLTSCSVNIQDDSNVTGQTLKGGAA
ncbi:hypothetical protein AVEN_24378-1 [Araneus ventricosus]|uniref:Ig-like domain-containing protein n=1 Tax=Araneus ventricosus TaxID=182803 RepID=A0A4Y2HUE8_ARAVE|nr:hypothetical protein AVEN_24378-1 [Araneus ventricosus]